jgi:hypothetical protein
MDGDDVMKGSELERGPAACSFQGLWTREAEGHEEIMAVTRENVLRIARREEIMRARY